eukprot:CAMPEP_0202692014 /NCGR_PEP_ID=MMETSP1385-20130828/6522_1 /ASSEMBLY_ACC=CAM_ASM_000861 /TAXON_ID=933848 /ORGANISM="Elphidium margaritaceum" /LENGTH=183 /DNA_ID=CAMNT_0049347479 /DNA_START=26 /DNA_END=577 /DNA_ORIENTATION=-
MPKYMRFNYYKDQESKDDDPNAYHHYSIPDAASINKVTVYCDVSDEIIEAPEMYRVTIEIDNFSPVIIGIMDCSQKQIHAQVPSLFKSTKRGTCAIMKVYRVEAPLAWKTAGEEFEHFMAALTDKWRVQVMNMVKEGMQQKAIDENTRVSPVAMNHVFHCLHQHLRSDQLSLEFQESKKKITQ